MKDILNFYGVALQAGLSAISFLHICIEIRNKKQQKRMPLPSLTRKTAALKKERKLEILNHEGH